jgi:CRP-like cAMP-binding protein
MESERGVTAAAGKGGGTMVDLDFLGQLAMFRGLDDAQLKAVADRCRQIDYQRDQQLFVEGEKAEHLWLLAQGQVDLRGSRTAAGPENGQEPIAFISEPDLFGWGAFIPPYRYHLSGFCASRRCRVVRMAKSDLDELCAADARMGYTIMRYVLGVIGRHFHQFQDELAKRRGQHIMSGW